MPDLSELETSEQISKAKAAVYNLLARREYSKHELAFKLSQKAYSDEVIQLVLDEFSNTNQQSDYRTAEMLLSHGYKSGWGPNKIRNNMQAKGIASSIIDRVLADDYSMFINDVTVLSQTSAMCVEPGANLEALSSSASLTKSSNKQQKLNSLKNLISKMETREVKSHNYQSIAEINNSNQDRDWYQSALKQAQKKFAKEVVILNNKENNSMQLKAKLYKFLYNRGFEQEHIDYAIKSLLNNAC